VKRLPILTRMLLLLVCFSFMLFAYNSGSTLNDNIILPYVEFAPEAIDGEMEEEWIFPPNGNFVFELADEDTIPATIDHSAFWKAAYNADGFYFWAKVLDDSIYDESATVHENDCFEIYFDGDDSDNANYSDGNDVQWRYVYGLTEVGAAGWCDIGANGECAWLETEDGYQFELLLDAADLADTNIVLAPGTEIGFEVQTADNDGAGRETITKWWNVDGMSWQQPLLFGNAMCGDDGDLAEEVVGDFVVNMEFGPEIDAENTENEWDEVPEVKMSVCENWAMANDEGFRDFQPYYRAAWNADGFYFFAKVLDDTLVNDVATVHENDCFEIYFDGGNEKAAAYDENDVQWRWIYGLEDYSQGTGSATCENEEHAWMEIDGGYQFELMIPTSDLTFTPEEGAVIGFEVQCADNDGDGRDVISKWWNVDGMSWQEPVLFGTVELSATSTAPGPPEVAGVEVADEEAGVNVSVPSIVTSSVLAVSSANDIANVVLYNIAGQEVAAAAGNGGNAVLNVGEAPNGVYLCKVETENGSVTKKVTLLK